MNYTEHELLRLARRRNNAKRSYLLVNPLQGKHVPVAPSQALGMMDALADVAARSLMAASADPRPVLVIGFAETATAIGAVVAARLGEHGHYVTTTREAVPGVNEWLHFSEEHSHAVEQKLCTDGLDAVIDAGAQLVLVDDELSTGRTLINIAAQLRARFPKLRNQRFLAVSVINRLSEENRTRLREAGIDCAALLQLPDEDYTSTVAQFDISIPMDARDAALPAAHVETHADGQLHLPDARRCLPAQNYMTECRELAGRLIQTEALRRLTGRRVRVLGTEEFMFPALLLARTLEPFADVRFHATTRSPIGICTAPGYPITSGCRLRSVYEAERETYIYNLDRCDVTLLFTDATLPAPGLCDLAHAVSAFGCDYLLALCVHH